MASGSVVHWPNWCDQIGRKFADANAHSSDLLRFTLVPIARVLGAAWILLGSTAVLRQFANGARIVCVAVALASYGCTRQDARLQQHREKFESLGATTAAIAESWLAGSTSGTYTLTALEQTFLLVEQERATLASSPDALIDPRGARLSQAAESLSRLIAELRQDVRAADASAVRQRLARIPIKPAP